MNARIVASARASWLKYVLGSAVYMPTTRTAGRTNAAPALSWPEDSQIEIQNVDAEYDKTDFAVRDRGTASRRIVALWFPAEHVPDVTIARGDRVLYQGKTFSVTGHSIDQSTFALVRLEVEHVS